MPTLISPTTSLYVAFQDCRDDWGPGLHENGFGIGPEDDLDSPDGFADWVRRRLWLDHGAGAPCPDERHASCRWIVEDGQVLGGIAMRHWQDDDLGQIGYGERPSARTIESQGGVLQGILDTGHVRVRRYWITLSR
ncbi:GNAT family N-acetyltransferase [Micromonospora sp. WMMD980]|uniref:GNAT family N-acetyltransferase n=1 Tax=Micromonospora sp. WMMD980 TaxID=3016088 RepID=UPI002415FBDF|nr:GNAT family N-acetyltransferase [Micromonospora sp. WMMD980]MDG4801096.1 GNAT family N-acetyltransferase [Micromonospora sp. WMMD980]